MKKNVFVFIIITLILGCKNQKYYTELIINPVLERENMNHIQQEIDDIYSLLTYSLVYKDWQPESLPRSKRRGYNIGALLVDKNNLPVKFELNCINSTDNATQHGEVRAITSYLENTRSFNLSGFTVYTTLEPCVMCAGMMTMTAVKRVVYGQRDVEYSKAFERLAIDTRPIGGFAPYPRRVLAQASDIQYCKDLDMMYREFLEKDDEKILAKFLASNQAKEVYQRATDQFLNYKVNFDENRSIYQRALEFYISK